MYLTRLTDTSSSLRGLVLAWCVYVIVSFAVPPNSSAQIRAAEQHGVGVCAGTPSGIVGWWPLNDNVVDSVSGATTTASGGANFVAGRVGQGLHLDGIDDRVKIESFVALNVGRRSGEFTVELWINPAKTTAQALVEWNTGTGSGFDGVGVHLWQGMGEEGNLYANIRDEGGGDHTFSSAGGALVAGAYSHVALTYQQHSGLARLYLNGAIIAEAALGSFVPLTSYPIYLGVRPVGPDVGHYFEGIMDELSIYNRALSKEELLAIYQAGQAGKCPDLPPPPPTPPDDYQYDILEDFSQRGNPDGVWSYGWQTELGGAFTLFRILNRFPAGGFVWAAFPSESPSMWYYRRIDSSWKIGMFPGRPNIPENFCVLRFTAPETGHYALDAGVRAGPFGERSGDTDFHVVINGLEVFGQQLPSGDHCASYSNLVSLAAGEIVDFVVGRGADNISYESGLNITARITLDDPPLLPARLEGVHVLESGQVQFTIVADAGISYVIEASDDLIHWEGIRTVQNSPTSVIVQDSEANQHPARFYRLSSD